jgi:hypothetical protein
MDKMQLFSQLGRQMSDKEIILQAYEAMLKEIFRNYCFGCAESDGSANQAQAIEKKFMSNVSMARKARDRAISLLQA